MADDRRIGAYLTRPFSRWRASRRGVRIDSKDSIPSGRVVRDLDFGVMVNNKTALANTAYYAGIRIISENFGSLPKSIRKWDGKGNVTGAPSHRLNKVLHKPNAYMNDYVFWSTLALWVKDWGNAYALIERNPAGDVVALHPAHPTGVRCTLSEGRKWYDIKFIDIDLQSMNGIYSDDDVLHFMELTVDGIKGENPVMLNATALEKAAAQEKFAAEFFRKGGQIKGVMETERSMGDDMYKKFLEHVRMASENFDTLLLEYGVKYKQVAVNPVVAQLIQSETMSVQDVCRILGIPPHMVAELSHATFSNIEHQTIQFVQYTLRPLVKRFEAELEAKLFFDREREDFSIEFNLDGLLRGDTAARSAYYHNAILDGYLSRNEVRALEGYERKEGLDDLLYPLNSGVVGKEEKNVNE